MTLQINGTAKCLQKSRNIIEMVTELGLPAPTILIEHNGVALRRGEWHLTKIADGDRIEILQVAAGG